MRVLVLGAGVIGVTSAWYLRQAGFDVCIVERQPDVALETSFANGGQISASHAEPWASPHLLPDLMRWLGRDDAPFLITSPCRRLFESGLWRWGLAFLNECRAANYSENVRQLLSLACYSREQLENLQRALDFNYQRLACGILHIYTDSKALALARLSSALMRQYGLYRQDLEAASCVALEPSLAQAAPPVLGGDYTADDESGDARLFTSQLAEHALSSGVEFRFEATAKSLLVEGNKVVGVELESGELLQAEACVVSMGSYSPRILRPLGINLPIVPAKGYSATLQLESDSGPTVSLIDDASKIVISRLGDQLRVAGTAELAGYDLQLDQERCQMLMRRLGQLFPSLETKSEPVFWCGLRPLTPNHLPVIGQAGRNSGYSNLWLNTGHGTLGWTLACGSGSLLADLMLGRQTAVSYENKYLKLL